LVVRRLEELAEQKDKKTDKNVVLLVRKLVHKLKKKAGASSVDCVQGSKLGVKYVKSKDSKTKCLWRSS